MQVFKLQLCFANFQQSSFIFVKLENLIQSSLVITRWTVGKVNRPTIVFLSGFYCSRGEHLVHQKRKYFHET